MGKSWAQASAAAAAGLVRGQQTLAPNLLTWQRRQITRRQISGDTERLAAFMGIVNAI